MSDKELRELQTAMGKALANAFNAPIGQVLGLTKKAKPRKSWLSPPPEFCDICGIEISPEGEFVDGKTKMGPWGIMCVPCHGSHGVGLGMGLGQKYHLEADGKWYKVEG